MKNIRLVALFLAAFLAVACTGTAADSVARAAAFRRKTSALLAIRGGAAKQNVSTATKNNSVVKSSESRAFGYVSLLGGALCHLVLGTMYCWGNFSAYTPLHLKYFGDSALSSQPDTLWVLPFAFIAQMSTMPIGPWFQKKIGCRATALLGCWVMVSGVLLASFANNLALFIFCYSVMFGCGVGIAYSAPMVNGWRWFPNNKGLVSGITVAGFGAGGFVFNQVGSRFINPNGVNAVNGVYPSAIYSAFPVMLRRLATIYFVLTGLGSLLVIPPPQPTIDESKKVNVTSIPEGSTLKEALKTVSFWKLWMMALLSGTAGINVVGIYKNFGSRIHADDKFHSLIGSIGALANGSGRLFWGNTVDAFGFKRPFAALVSIQSFLMAMYAFVSKSRLGFALATCGILFCLGGNFAMFPAVTTREFGVRSGALIYGILFSAFGIASVSGTFITKALIQTFGWTGVFRTMSILSLLALGVLSTFDATLAG